MILRQNSKPLAHLRFEWTIAFHSLCMNLYIWVFLPFEKNSLLYWVYKISFMAHHKMIPTKLSSQPSICKGIWKKQGAILVNEIVDDMSKSTTFSIWHQKYHESSFVRLCINCFSLDDDKYSFCCLLSRSVPSCMVFVFE